MRAPENIRSGRVALKSGDIVLQEAGEGHFPLLKPLQALQGRFPVDGVIGIGRAERPIQTVAAVQGEDRHPVKAVGDGKHARIPGGTSAANGQLHALFLGGAQGGYVARAEFLTAVEQGAVHIHGNQSNGFHALVLLQKSGEIDSRWRLR